MIVRAARQNAEAKQARIDAAATWEAGRKERDVVEAIAKVIATPDDISVASAIIAPMAAPDTSSAPKPKSKKRNSTRCECLYLL